MAQSVIGIERVSLWDAMVNAPRQMDGCSKYFMGRIIRMVRPTMYIAWRNVAMSHIRMGVALKREENADMGIPSSSSMIAVEGRHDRRAC